MFLHMEDSRSEDNKKINEAYISSNIELVKKIILNCELNAIVEDGQKGEVYDRTFSRGVSTAISALLYESLESMGSKVEEDFGYFESLCEMILLGITGYLAACGSALIYCDSKLSIDNLRKMSVQFEVVDNAVIKSVQYSIQIAKRDRGGCA